MHTIHFPEKIIPAYDVEVFEYDELSDDAKERAFDNFVASGEPQFQLEMAIDEIFSALCDFDRETGVEAEIDCYNVLHLRARSFERLYDKGFQKLEDTGICYSMDICDAWNAHVEKLSELWETWYSAEYGEPSYEAEDALDAEIRAALRDVGVATQRNIDAEVDYYTNHRAEFFEEFDADEHEYTADGEIWEEVA